MAANPHEILQQIELQEPAIAAAFLLYVRQMVDAAQVRAIEVLIAQGRVEQIAAVLGVTPAALSALTEAIRTAFVAGGQFGASDLPALRSPNGGALRVRFDVRNPRAEAWLRDHSSTLVTNVIREQVDAIRTVVTQGTVVGQNPRRTALDIVGRINSQTGRRSGGILGLTNQQAGFVANARAQLLSGAPDQMRGYFSRQLRDRRFDVLVRRAMDAGKPVAAADVDRILARYADRLLRLRGETIARTEALAAFNTARDEAMRQAIDTGAVSPQNVVKIWRTGADARVRDAHAAMGGQRVAFDQPFRSPTGALLRFPGDSSLGAGAADIANCFAPWTRVSPDGVIGAIKSHYSGQLIKLSIAGEVDLAVTANHPILTRRGWVAGCDVVEGDEVLYCGIADSSVARADPEVANADPSAEQLYRSAKALGQVHRPADGMVNLHGYIPSHDVDVVTLPRELRSAFESTRPKSIADLSLAETDVHLGVAMFDSCSRTGDLTSTVGSNGLMRGLNSRGPRFRIGQRGALTVCLAAIRGLQSKVSQATDHRRATYAKFARDAEHWVAAAEKFRCLLVMLHARLQSTPFGALGAFLEHDRLGSGGFAEVAQTRAHLFSADAQGFRDVAHTRAAGVQLRDIGEQANASDLPVVVRRVEAAVSFHYEGPVFNFETINGVAIAERIVTHNCRCIAMTKVDFLRQGLE